MSITLQITIKSVYGEDKAYPVNEAARCVACIAGTKTLTKAALVQCLIMGCEIHVLDLYGKVSKVFNKPDPYNLPMVA